MMINLRQKDRDTICCIAKNSFKSPVTILAYGSRVNGDCHEASDLDLVIHAADSEPLDWGEQLDFQEQIQQSNIPILVQAFDWNRLPESFRRNISEKYEVLFSNVENS